MEEGRTTDYWLPKNSKPRVVNFRIHPFSQFNSRAPGSKQSWLGEYHEFQGIWVRLVMHATEVLIFVLTPNYILNPER